MSFLINTLDEILQTARVPFSILAIMIIILQGPQGEGLLQRLSDTGIFSSFRDTKYFLNLISWVSIIGYILIQLGLFVLHSKSTGG